MLATGFGTGAQIIMARRYGERRYNRIAPTFIQGCYFMLAASALLFFISDFFSPDILRGIIDSPDVYQATNDYLYWRNYGFFFSFLGVMFRSYYVAIGQTKILTVNSVVMILSNVALNYCLIFGKLGCPAMGIAGAAIASSVAEAFSLFFFIIYTALKADKRKYGFYRAFTFRPALLRGMLNISGWTMVQSFISISVWFIIILAIEHLGERQLAVTNIIRNISAMLFMIVCAYAITTEAMISHQIGAGHPRLMFKICGRALRLNYATLCPILILLWIFPEYAMRIFTDDPALVAQGIGSLYVMSVSILFTTPAFILFNAVSGTGNTRSGFILEMISLAVYSAFVYFFIVLCKPDVALCWIAEYVYAAVMLTLSYWYLKSGKWKGKKV